MAAQFALELNDIDLYYGYVRALSSINFAVRPGETVALLGDNGAGKSTLLKVMSGAHRPSAGTVRVHGEVKEFHAPRDAADAGIEMVYQDLALVDAQDTATNMLLGRELLLKGPLGILGFLDRKAMREEAKRQIAHLGVKIDNLTRPVEMLSGGQRQGVALARSSVRVEDHESGILLLDEPTAALGYEQKMMVEQMIERMAAKGIAVVLVTHDLPLAFKCADRMVVLNRSRKVADIATKETNNDQIVGWITGSRADQTGIN